MVTEQDQLLLPDYHRNKIMSNPTPRAIQAALLIQDAIKDARKRTGFIDVIPGTDEIARIIDKCFLPDPLEREKALELCRIIRSSLE